MSTGQTSSSFAASAASPAIASSTSTPMNMPSASGAALLSAILLFTIVRDLRDLLGHRDARPRRGARSSRSAVSSLPSTIVPAWPKLMPGISSMNRPAMNATIGRRESFSVTQLRELGLHAAARLGVDDDRLGLLVGLEQRHQLGVGRADDRVAADRDRGRLAEAGGGQRRGHLGRHAAGAGDHADRGRAGRPSRRPSPGRRCRPS